MTDLDLRPADEQRHLAQARETIHDLEQELAETNRGLIALTMELEQRVDERTAELRAAQEELQKTNSELLLLTLDLETRVAERTEELQAKHNELNAMTQQLWQTAKLATMGELAASVAHELNNPLAIISLRLESVLAQLPQDDPKQRALTVVEHEVERMGNLVSGLLEFSRQSPQHISTIDVIEEIEKALELIQHHLRNHSIHVVEEFAPNIPPVMADKQQLRQVFLNLFTNASDAMPEGGTLTLHVTMSATTPQWVGIDITDMGMGIPPELLSKVTEPFFTTKPPGKGTGLGLPICRRIIQEHHGTFDIASAVGQGTTIHIGLPVERNGNSKHLGEL